MVKAQWPIKPFNHPIIIELRIKFQITDVILEHIRLELPIRPKIHQISWRTKQEKIILRSHRRTQDGSLIVAEETWGVEVGVINSW